MTEDARSGALAEMLDRLEMTRGEAEALAAKARDAEYWRALAPDQAIGAGAVPHGVPPDEDAARQIGERLRRDRYFASAPIFGEASLLSLNGAIDAVQAGGWPPVFSLVYDSLWSCARHPLIARVVEGHLGARCWQVPHVWVHLVPARAGARGWMPHFDGLRPRRLTIWIALTDATLDNGCIHLVPPDSLPASFRTTDLDATVGMRDVLRAMHATRALPAEAGSILGWDFDVFHWGGRVGAPGGERRSMSLEFLASDEPPCADEIPLIDPRGPLPSFDTRLYVIAEALQNYAAREASLRRFRALAPHLTRSPLFGSTR